MSFIVTAQVGRKKVTGILWLSEDNNEAADAASFLQVMYNQWSLTAAGKQLVTYPKLLHFWRGVVSELNEIFYLPVAKCLKRYRSDRGWF